MGFGGRDADPLAVRIDREVSELDPRIDGAQRGALCLVREVGVAETNDDGIRGHRVAQ